MYQSSNMFCPCSHEDTNYYHRPNTCCQPDCYTPCDCHKPCACHKPCNTHPCDCCKPNCHPCDEDCNAYDCENYYCRPGQCPCPPSCNNNCCNDMAKALCSCLGKKVIICINGSRACVILCEICGTFVKALAYKTGKTVYINICKIDDIIIPC